MSLFACIPTLNNYKGLIDMIQSAEKGDVKFDRFIIMDNGGYFSYYDPKVTVIRPGKNLGCAGSWNWFIQNVPEKRIIMNDDILFGTDSLRMFEDNLVDNWFCYPESNSGLNSFSFFYLPNSIISKVGLFDEEFYPAYFEDNDYHYRMQLAGDGELHALPCQGLIHKGSQTLKNFTPRETTEHHKNFQKNHIRFLQKWGGEPAHEIFKEPFNNANTGKIQPV